MSETRHIHLPPAKPKRLPLPPCMIREMNEADRDFVFGTYTKHGHGAFAFRNMTDAAFANYGSRLLDQVIKRSQVLVAENTDDGSLIAFSIAERPFKNIDQVVLHFVYVKAAYRQNRLCSKMIEVVKGLNRPRAQLFTTHMNPTWWLLSRAIPNIYNPFLLFPEFQTERKDK